ncbi:MAG: chromosome segregation protein SMC [Eubacteriales bacterium]
MYLKSIYINGFKSFANKIKLDINSKLTAVVGPNGSGKSNISDAFKWVLGEQSAKTLRGNVMSDVIFAGTKNKNPQGIAQVDLIFDNKDNVLPIEYNEVSITRKLYRSGESEYLINKEKTQLKKIRELFMDTGIGIDGYSIIGQGRIDEIISKNTETKRKVLEEAAGIVKYKSRKQETEKKLEKTKDNLDRINDIILEIENRIEPLKKQKENAEKYLEVKKDLKSIEINLLAQEYKKYITYEEELKDEKAKRNQELRDLETKRNHFEEKLEDEINEVSEIDVEIIEYERNLNDLEKKINKNKNNIQIEKEKIKLYEKKLESLEINLGDYKGKIQVLDDKKEKISDIINDNKEKIKSSAVILEEYKSNLQKIKSNLDSKDSYIKNSKNEIFKLYQSLSEEKSKIDQIYNQTKIEKQKLDDNKELLNYCEKTLVENKGNIKKLEEKIENSKKIELESKKRLVDYKNKYLKEEENLEKLKTKLNNNNNNIERHKNLINIKTRIRNSYEGFYKSIQDFMKYVNKGKYREEVEGVVVELIKVDKKYIEAINTALGASAQNVIIKKEKYVSQIINFLKSERIGRMTFLPMDTIKGRELNKYQKNASKIDGYIGTGDSLIKYEKKYNNIFKFLLGRTIICRDINSGIKIAKSISYSTNIVTLEGEIIYSGGAITGGSKKKTNNLIGREEEISSLKNEKKKLETTKVQIKEKIEKYLKSLKEVKGFLEKENLRLENLVKEREKNEINLTNFKTNLHNKESEKIELKNKIEVNNKNILKLENKLKIEKEELEKIDQNINDHENKIKDNDVNLEQVKREEIKTTSNINNLNVELSKRKNELEINETRFEEINESIEDAYKNITNTEEEIEINKNLNLESNNKIQKYCDLINTESKILADKKKVFDELKEKRKNLQRCIYEKQSKTNSISKEINNIQKDINSLEVKLERYENKLSNTKNRLWNDYEMNYAIAKTYINEKQTINLLNKKTKSLKYSIKKLGDINISSIEEYKETSKRYEFLNGQRNDLFEAKDKLNNIIEDLTKKMHGMFLTEYEKINEVFKNVFIDLFSGGDAEIILSDIENPLTCDIEIYAQPPGKNLNKISLLSGGEKALTAISLLFSILKIKPTPFCILDEIEAALDDANVYRFANYLKKFSNKTQFLIITHRKGTMEFVDTIYGTTMEEEGVTKIISMNLSDLIQKEFVNE